MTNARVGRSHIEWELVSRTASGTLVDRVDLATLLSSLSSQPGTGTSALAPAQRAGAQRLCALARTRPARPVRRRLFIGVDRKWPAAFHAGAIDPYRKSRLRSTHLRDCDDDDLACSRIISARATTTAAATLPCACPDDTMRNGRACGGRSTYSRPSGASPLCYPSDVTTAMIESCRQRTASRQALGRKTANALLVW
jgi:hypothetical protein